MQGFTALPGASLSLAATFKSGMNGIWAVGTVMSPGSRFQFVAVRELDPNGLGVCGRAESQIGQVPGGDSDGDGVVNESDSCPDVDGPEDASDFPGCPTLARTVTAHYADGRISGLVTTENPDACRHEAAMQGFTALPGASLSLAATFKSGMNGIWAVGTVMSPGSRFQFVAVRELDPNGLGVCGRAESQIGQVPGGDDDSDGVVNESDSCPDVDGPDDASDFPGCPTLARTVTAAYADAAITGQVSVLGPNPAPAGTCLPTQVRAFTVTNGAPVQVGATTDTTATGSYTIALGSSLAAGSTYFVTTDRYLDGDVAVCGAAESATHQVDPALHRVARCRQEAGAARRPGAARRHSDPVAPVLSGVKLTKKVIHVVGSRAEPRATKLRLGLNVAAKVVVKVKGTRKATGKKVLARLVQGPRGGCVHDQADRQDRQEEAAARQVHGDCPRHHDGRRGHRLGRQAEGQALTHPLQSSDVRALRRSDPPPGCSDARGGLL